MEKLNKDLIALNDILIAISDIEDFTYRSSMKDRMTIMAVAYEIAIIGEAANKISFEIQKKYFNIPWGDIIGMRHRIIHDYGKVSIDRLKEVVEKHLPVLRNNIELIIKQLTSNH